MKLGRYELISELGRGGMATVYRARDPQVEREVAVKVLPRHFSQDPQFLTRFRREVKTIGRLDNRHIVPIYDVGEEDGQPYLVMPLLTGGTLTDRLRDGPLALDAALQLLAQVADALDDAHAQGIIHRDLKPSNVLLDRRGAAYLSDFGIAKALDVTAQLTGSGIIGTPAYMSPEQFRGGLVDGRSDLYSLAIVTFEMLAGRRPFEGDTAQLMYRHIHEPPPSLHELNPGLPAELDPVLLRALAKNQDDRFGTIGEFLAALRLAAAPTRRAETPTLLEPPVAPAGLSQAATVAEVPIAPAEEAPKSIGPQPAGGADYGAPSVPPLVAEAEVRQAAAPDTAGKDARRATVPGRPRRAWVGLGVLGLLGVAVLASLAVVIVNALSTPSAGGAAPAVSIVREAKALAFASNRDGDFDVYLINKDGSGLINLTSNSPADEIQPAFSRDGQRIAFVTNRDGNEEVYWMNADGAGQTNLTNNPADDYSPAWWPAGSIAFVSERDGNPEIYVTTGGGPSRITDNPAHDTAPAWSPDSDLLGFASDREGNYDIYVIASGAPEAITHDPAADANPRWSPQGSLAFQTNRDGNYEVYYILADGYLNATNHPADDFSPAFSADGKWLAFVSDRDGNSEIYVRGPDGVSQNLTHDRDQDIDPAWQP